MHAPELGRWSHAWNSLGSRCEPGLRWVLEANPSLGSLTCDQAGDNERQHQHLQHPHEELSREREVLDLAVAELVWAQGKGQADP